MLKINLLKVFLKKLHLICHENLFKLKSAARSKMLKKCRNKPLCKLLSLVAPKNIFLNSG